MTDTPLWPTVLGHYDNLDGKLHDPGVTGLCVYCGKKMGKIDRPIKTFLVVGLEQHAKVVTVPVGKEGEQCYFYRYHLACWDKASEKDREGIWNYISRAVTHRHASHTKEKKART